MSVRVDAFGYTLEIDSSLIDAPEAEIRAQIDEYLAGERREFDLDVAVPGGFTGDVMRSMLATPYGETKRYGDVAAELGSAPVAVGQACGRNPVPIVVPCHRIVGADGIGGYSLGDEQGPDCKAELLALEAGETTHTLDEYVP